MICLLLSVMTVLVDAIDIPILFVENKALRIPKGRGMEDYWSYRNVVAARKG
jgi:hypothetical protein